VVSEQEGPDPPGDLRGGQDLAVAEVPVPANAEANDPRRRDEGTRPERPARSGIELSRRGEVVRKRELPVPDHELPVLPRTGRANLVQERAGAMPCLQIVVQDLLHAVVVAVANLGPPDAEGPFVPELLGYLPPFAYVLVEADPDVLGSADVSEGRVPAGVAIESSSSRDRVHSGVTRDGFRRVVVGEDSRSLPTKIDVDLVAPLTGRHRIRSSPLPDTTLAVRKSGGE